MSAPEPYQPPTMQVGDQTFQVTELTVSKIMAAIYVLDRLQIHNCKMLELLDHLDRRPKWVVERERREKSESE